MPDYTIKPEDILVIPPFLGYWQAQCRNGKAWDHNNLKSLPDELRLFHGSLVNVTQWKVHRFMTWQYIVPLAKIIMQKGHDKKGIFQSQEEFNSHRCLTDHFLTLSNEQAIWHCINYIKNESK